MNENGRLLHSSSRFSVTTRLLICSEVSCSCAGQAVTVCFCVPDASFVVCFLFYIITHCERTQVFRLFSRADLAPVSGGFSGQAFGGFSGPDLRRHSGVFLVRFCPDSAPLLARFRGFFWPDSGVLLVQNFRWFLARVSGQIRGRCVSWVVGKEGRNFSACPG